jgi:uncharacterized membrane protein YidH (DUF202 family)
MGVFLKIVLVGYLVLLAVYAGLRLAGHPREIAAKRLRVFDSIFFYAFLALVIVVTVVFR